MFADHTRVALQKLIAEGAVRMDGKTLSRAAFRVPGGCEIDIDFAQMPPREEECAPEDLPLNIVHEDDAIIVVNKAAGMVTHPGNGNRNGTLQSALMFHHPPAAALPRAGIVHRLDKDTSGLLVAAKTEAARQFLLSRFLAREVRREYWTLVHGEPPATGVINRPLAPAKPGKMAVRHSGKEALTRYVVLRRWRGFSLLCCRLETGRTHQIRAHLEYLGYPVAGDPSYRRRARELPFDMPRQALHAKILRLPHPTDGETMSWDAPPPEDFQAALRALDAV